MAGFTVYTVLDTFFGVAKYGVPYRVAAPGESEAAGRQLPELQIVEDTRPADEPIGTSLLGRPLYTELRLLSATWKRNDGTQVTTPEISFPGAVVHVSRRATIVKTAVEGRTGTVKEHTGFGDHMIRVQTVLFDPSFNRYPANEVRALREVLDARVSLRASCRIFELLGITHVAIDAWNLPDPAPIWNAQPVELEMLSDVPPELDYSDEQTKL